MAASRSCAALMEIYYTNFEIPDDDDPEA